MTLTSLHQHTLELGSILFLSFSYVSLILNNQQEQDLLNVEKDNYVYQRLILPKYYATVNQVKQSQDLNYSSFDVELGNWDDYEFHDELGHGASGTAYTGKKISTSQKVVIKTFFDEMKLRGIRKEVKLLRTVHDHPYIAELVDVIRAPDTGFISIVYNYYETEKEGTSDLFVALTDKGNRFFLFKVLKAIDYAHSRGVIHGDIKPLNIIANSESKMLKIIDWGLGNFYRPGAIMSTHIGTRSYKAPELLLGFATYDYQIDMFAAGLMLSKMLFRKGPFFAQKFDNWTDNNHLIRISKVLGSQPIHDYITKYNMPIDWETLNVTQQETQDFQTFITPDNQKYCSDDALDLLQKMLIIDHAERIHAKDALEHPYFDPIRDMI